MPITLPKLDLGASEEDSEKSRTECLDKVAKLTAELESQQTFTNDLAKRVEELERRSAHSAGASTAMEETSKAEGGSTLVTARLLSAFYHDMDVTDKINEMLMKSGGTLKFEGKGHTVNKTLGDPARGMEKILCLTWIDGSGNYKRKALRELRLDKGMEVQLW